MHYFIDTNALFVELTLTKSKQICWYFVVTPFCTHVFACVYGENKWCMKVSYYVGYLVHRCQLVT